jgi:hypothetical protein
MAEFPKVDARMLDSGKLGEENVRKEYLAAFSKWQFVARSRNLASPAEGGFLH